MGLRRALRQMLYRERRHHGCEQADYACKCKVGCTCAHHLVIEGLSDEMPEAMYANRLRHLVRLEQMRDVGCKFGPNDLDFDQWRDLIILAQERHWMDSRLDTFRERQREQKAQADKALAEGRKELGIPPPGHSLFPKKR